ncbi:MAG: hypothetical protein CSA33_08720 [Desulfobulbus propionicus]|nr:MAG: hypothetical protein CSA33_08720 [Desulfobulbus propionicus]
MKKLTQQLYAQLEKGENLVLVTICNQSGSTPREAGAHMLVSSDGSTVGTIGGGIVEAQAIQDAVRCLEEQRSRRTSFDLTNHAAADTDMICGGTLELHMEYIRPSPESLKVFQALLHAITSGRRVTLVCPLDSENDSGRFIVNSQGQAGKDDIAPGLLTAVKRARSGISTAAVITHKGASYLLSSFAARGHLLLLGAGHVAACTAQVAARVGFRITVLDDRPEFANSQRFPQAEHIVVLPDFSNCFADQEINEDSYLVIVTRGHLHDQEVLEQALQTKAGYIGMIGSRKKRDALYQRLLDRGVSQEQLDQVYSPIGLSIKAETPEEIAVSIVGELICQRATDRKR